MGAGVCKDSGRLESVNNAFNITGISGVVTVVFLIFSQRCPAAVLEVRSSGQIQAVRTAIQQARDGDTILLRAGIYSEYDILVDKPLTIKGVDYPTIDAEGKGQIMEIAASGVTISGLCFVGTPASHIKENSAVLLNKVRNCKILDNRFVDNFFAVYAAKSDQCEISENQIIGKTAIYTEAGNGIHLWYCNDMTIENNSIKGHRDGIYLEFVTNSMISGNRSEANLRYGLHFMYSDSCRYDHNAFVRNGAGVAVMYTKHVEMIDNDFQENWGGASYGLLLKDISASRVIDNRFKNNTVGIQAEGSNHVLIERNLFDGNGWAIKIMSNCLNCEIDNNNFLNNSFQVATNSRHANSTFNGNYWSSYRGFDFDGDGFGDLPYRPVSLFSLLVESNPPTLIFLRSLLIEALDLAERIVPTLTPEALIDSKPRMRPVL